MSLRHPVEGSRRSRVRAERWSVVFLSIFSPARPGLVRIENYPSPSWSSSDRAARVHARRRA